MLLNCDTICVLKGQSHYNSCINPAHVKDLKAGDDIGLEAQVDLISDVTIRWYFLTNPVNMKLVKA